jgi:hypothetical protein|tara:strand:+ start:244 stop:762 length:519 start_codon:yes stop_codon:yes gene_type:complete
MITTKIKDNIMTPAERKAKVAKLREEHQPYFDKNNKHALYIPKMAYRPSGKDELHVSFFPSELQKEKDIYTEFVSIEYDTEDPKRTLYFLKHNPHWKEEYELVTSNSGFERHIVPVSELKIINDVNSRRSPIKKKVELKDFIKVKDPEKRDIVDVLKGIERALLSINQKLDK